MVNASVEKTKTIHLGNRKIGPGEDLFFIAEIGINHNQDLDLAYRQIDAAVAAGCDAAKFQTFKAKDLYVDRVLSGSYHLMGRDIPIYDLHIGLEMPEDWIPKLQDYCNERNIVFFSTPVAREGTDWLDRAGVPAFKISSYDFTNHPLLKYVASKGKPVIFSNGGGSLAETEEAVQILQKAAVPFAMMHCVAKYPAPYHTANLAVMETLRLAFDVPVGFSDNGFADASGTIDSGRVPLAAAQLGADLFEIHITVDRTLPGADHGFATLPHELKTMVARMREARRRYNEGKRVAVDPILRGSSVKRMLPEEEYVRNFVCKCVFARTTIKKGEKLTDKNIAVLRPGQHRRGLEPKYFELLLTKAKATRDIAASEPITWDTVL